MIVSRRRDLALTELTNPLLSPQGDQVTGPNTAEHCGENGGQHMYLDAGAYTDNSAALNMVLSGNTARKWRIKVKGYYHLLLQIRIL